MPSLIEFLYYLFLCHRQSFPIAVFIRHPFPTCHPSLLLHRHHLLPSNLRKPPLPSYYLFSNPPLLTFYTPTAPYSFPHPFLYSHLQLALPFPIKCLTPLLTPPLSTSLTLLVFILPLLWSPPFPVLISSWSSSSALFFISAITASVAMYKHFAVSSRNINPLHFIPFQFILHYSIRFSSLI